MLLSQEPFDVYCHWWSKVKQPKDIRLARNQSIADDWIWQMQTKTVPSIATVRQIATDSCKLKIRTPILSGVQGTVNWDTKAF